MEDTHIHLDSHSVDGVPFKKIAYYGVYDGHGGKTTADLVQDMLHKTVFETQEFREGQPVDSLVHGFKTVDDFVVEKSNNEGWMNGTTAVVGMVLDGTLYIGNVGDAEACLVSVVNNAIPEGGVENLTYPHKASDPAEKKRIEDLGGHVFFWPCFWCLSCCTCLWRFKVQTTKDVTKFCFGGAFH